MEKTLHVLFLAVGVFAGMALSAYLVMRCDRRLSVAAVVVFHAGFCLLLFSRGVGLTAVSAERRILHSALATAGLAVAAGAGAWYSARLALSERQGWRAAGFAFLAAAALASDRVTPPWAAAAAWPLVPGVGYLCVVAYLFLGRRHLFPELTRNVLDASVFDSRDAVVVFDQKGAHIESGVRGLDGVVSFRGMSDLGDFCRRVHEVKAAGEFFSPADVMVLGTKGGSRQVALAGAGGIRHYLCLVNPVGPGRRSRLGWVFGFYDITEHKRMEAEVVARTAELAEVNARLRAALPLGEQLASERARRDAVASIHATLGPRIEVLAARIRQGADLETLVQGCRAAMAEVRATVTALSAGDGPGGRA